MRAKDTVTREYVYQQIDIEREYQDEKWDVLDDFNNISDFLCYIKRYLDSAMQKNNPIETDSTLHDVRKIAALAVACLENHGCPSRV